MKTKQKFKKGDWVITPYNIYPVQLIEDSAWGVFYDFVSSLKFFKCSKEEAKTMELPYVCAVKDSRAAILSSEGYYLVEKVRKATAKDFIPLAEYATKNIKRFEKELKLYIKLMKNL